MTIPDALRSALAGRYELERPVGQGGMATVYLAADPKHSRRVAVKVLRPDLAATIGAERFLREIQIAARLQHPHILLLIDSGEAGGFLYYVMPFIDGESLRGRLDRAGRLDPEEVLALARQVADALDYAHRHGVVHRDIKPENILLSDGHAIVADFGVAKALSEASDKTITRTGYPVGTIGYMSPEQAAGFTDLDARSDVFSLTCVIYEMLLGRVPGMWPSDESGRVLRFLEAPAEVRALLDRLPGSVEQVLVRGLVLRPEGRFSTPRELVDALAESLGEKPRFRGEVVRRIVDRAAELEATTPTTDGSLSLGGIQQLAAEVGIPPRHVERAALELRARQPTQPAPNFFLGRPNRISAERFIEGELSEDEYATIVDEVRMQFGNVGQASTLGRSLSWRSVVPTGQTGRTLSLSVTPANGRTRIWLEETLTPAANGVFGGLMGAIGGVSVPVSIGIAVKGIGIGALAPVFIVASVGTAWMIARTVFRSIFAKRTVEIGEVADRLARYAEETIKVGNRPRLRR
ncbi:MAG: serine/threonine-protein kinase [Gemmatimonadales bacterium]